MSNNQLEKNINLNQLISGLEALTVPIHIVKPDGNIIYANKEFAKLINLDDPQKVLGKKCYEIFASEQCHTEECPLIMYKSNIELREATEKINEVILPDGKTKYLKTSNSPITKDGELLAVMELLEDLTDVKKSAQDVMDMLVSLAEGDLSKTLDTSNLHEDFVEIGEALNTLSISLDLGLRNISDTIKQIAEGDFSTEVEWEMPGVYSEIADNINQAINQLTTTIQQVKNVSVAIRDGNLEAMVDVSQLKGVFADIGNTINEMSISLDLGLRNISETVNKIAQGNLDTEVEWDMPGVYKEIIERINSALKNAYDVDKNRKEALEQLAANLSQFEATADRLRNPLAAITSAIELKDELGEERVLEIVGEHAKRIKEELDVMRKEEMKTHRLTEKSLEKL